MGVNIAIAAPELPQVDGTTGAPLGGIGTGAVKFCGNNGNLYFTDEAPAKCGNNGASYVALSSTSSTPATVVAQPMMTKTEPEILIKSGRRLDIRYSLDRPSRVLIALFNVNGQKIVDIVNRTESAGAHTMRWGAGADLSREMYIVTITAGDKKEVRKVMMLGK